MVMKKTSTSSDPPAYPQTPSEANGRPLESSNAWTLDSTSEPTTTRLANLNLHDDAADIEESSDWDASDKEDNDTHKIIDERPPGSRGLLHKASKPHLTEDQIPGPLKLRKPSSANNILQGTAAPVPSPGLPPSPQPASMNHSANPFRRAGNLNSEEAVGDSTTAWHTHSAGRLNADQPPTKPVNAGNPANPWDGDAQKPFLETVPEHATQPVGNPWAEEQRMAGTHGAATQEQAPVNEDKSYMADLIDLGTGQPTLHMSTAESTGQSHNAESTGQAHANGLPKHPPTAASQALQNSTARQNGPMQRNEHYQIKHIRWLDPKSKQNPRQSPILTQNANGPCPLLALVNALSLSTPPGLHTALLETLRTRETVSLGLLLDAVFDELMSGRRGKTAQRLPDVGELYSFLVTLHTGMNVNPRFVPDTNNGMFEQTKEMLLYSTFDIPLVHGWTPGTEDPAYAAFQATAASYEEAQNVQFREEDLEQKLGEAQLSNEEHSTLQNLPIIKQFLKSWPTQLTENGLRSLEQTIQPGEIAILFRNDHFSTVFKDLRSNQLMTLVTDAGYSSHDEIVWESLVDISGAKSELFSGDFRSVSYSNGAAASSADGREWTTVQGRRNKKQDATATPGHPAPVTTIPIPQSSTEQEDADLALALQLQEEEEHREREEAAARRREERLSENYLDNESARRGPNIPPRGRRTHSQTHRPQSPTANGDELPTYEQAASERRYQPPRGHPSSEHTPTVANAQRPGMGRIPGAGSSYTGRGNAGRGRGRGGRNTPFDAGGATNSAEAIQDRREGCTIM